MSTATFPPNDAAPRLVTYPTPSAFLRAVLPFDTWHLNIPLGTSLQYLMEVGDTAGEDGALGLWQAVWTGDKLECVQLPSLLPVPPRSDC